MVSLSYWVWSSKITVQLHKPSPELRQTHTVIVKEFYQHTRQLNNALHDLFVCCTQSLYSDLYSYFVLASDLT